MTTPLSDKTGNRLTATEFNELHGLPPHETISEVEGHLRRWQKILRLEDWDVTVRFMEVGADGPWAQTAIHDKSMEASIQMMRKSERAGAAGTRTDSAEELILHELLHLIVNPFVDAATDVKDSPKHVALEQGITRLTRALLTREAKRDAD